MKNVNVIAAGLLCSTALFALAATKLAAQAVQQPDTAPTPPAAKTAVDEEDPLVLSPFEVNSTKDRGYTATSTLGGTRINSDLRDLGSAISVVTSQFLQDTGATNNASLLQYTANTEVGGVYGNFGGVGNGPQVSEQDKLLRPNNNTRVRGLDSADNTRDFFLTDAPWDSYNVDRVDILRGANAMLFGVGSPAGIINSSLNPAKFANSFKVENRFGSYGSLRNSVDLNFNLIPQQLALRVSGLLDDEKYQQKPAFSNDHRYYAAVNFAPKQLNNDVFRTSLKVNFENGDIKANRPRSLPPIDAITPWFLTGAVSDSTGKVLYQNMNKQTWDPAVAWSNNGGVAKTGGANYNPWFNQAHFGQAFAGDVLLTYDANNSTPLQVRSPFTTQNFAIGATTPSFDTVTRSLGGLPYKQTLGIATFSSYASGSNLPGAQFGAWHDKSLTDSSIFDFYNNLIDGDNKKEWEKWKSLNVDFNQTYLGGRIGYDIAYNNESYKNGQESFLTGQQYQISVDINSKLPDNSDNPNAGRPYVSGKAQFGNGESFIDRNALHVTLTGDLRANDFLAKDSLIAHLLGHHIFTALYSVDRKMQEDRSFARWATDTAYADALGVNPNGLNNPERQIDYAIYIGPNLSTANSASGAGLSRVSAQVVPASNFNVYYFDSHWGKPTDPSAPGYVDPTVAYTYYDPLTNAATVANESANPANYVGWKTSTFPTLSADRGNIKQLYTGGAKNAVTVRSTSGNWQGYLWDGNIVATYGLRHDDLTHRSISAPFIGDTGVISTKYDISAAGSTKVVYKNTTSLWSLVVHAPKQLKALLPEGSDISFFYNHSDNWNAQSTRVDIEGRSIPNSTGQTKDYGVLIGALKNRLNLKINWYETSVKNATLQGDGAGLGATGIGQMYNIEAWTVGNAAILARGLYENRGQAWGWDYAWNDVGTAFGAFPRDPAGKAIDDAEKASIAAVQAGSADQQFFDNYGLNVDIAALRAGDWDHVITGKSQEYLDGQGNSGQPTLISATGGLINGMNPVATTDNTSKGIEFELTAQPIDNLNLSFNASKTTATRSNPSATLVNFINHQYNLMNSPAGDIRQWWGGDQTLRKVWTQTVWGPYQNLLAQSGSTAPEIRPWRFNGVASYYFSRGIVKGINVGAGYRWQQGSITGYQLQSYTDPDKEILDVNKPYRGPSEDAFDFWIGYEHKLTARFNWKVQLNVRNAGQKAHLIPISVQPDGTPAQYRIGEGQSWTVTNTLTF